MLIAITAIAYAAHTIWVVPRFEKCKAEPDSYHKLL
jgi:hypothetical protein